MGYTHYYRQDRDATPEEWADIRSDFATLLCWGRLPPIGLGDGLDEDEDEDDAIRFNGIGADGHEDMILEREGSSRNFCKTARKPYDDAVTALLILANHHAPGAWMITSDGSPEDWSRGLTIARGIRPDAALPDDIE